MVFLLLPQDGTEATTGFQIFDLITRLGITGVFVYMWYEERRERRASQERERDVHQHESALLERMIPVLTEATSALERVQTSMTKVQENLTEQYPHLSGSQLSSLVHRMDVLTEELRSIRPKGG